MAVRSLRGRQRREISPHQANHTAAHSPLTFASQSQVQLSESGEDFSTTDSAYTDKGVQQGVVQGPFYKPYEWLLITQRLDLHINDACNIIYFNT